MKLRLSVIILLGLAVAAAVLVIEGGRNMSKPLNDAEGGTLLSASDVPFSATFETATFALG